MIIRIEDTLQDALAYPYEIKGDTLASGTAMPFQDPRGVTPGIHVRGPNVYLRNENLHPWYFLGQEICHISF